MEPITEFNFTEIETQVLSFWEEKDLRRALNERNKDGEPFYFLDGPPYTSGKLHLGHAWNKALKDMVIRYKRMQGCAVKDRAGYDMHGLPIEHATQKELGISDAKDIESMGAAEFTKACKELAISNLKKMNEDFKKLGVWMDFDDAYMSVSKEFMEGQWWFIKTAFEKNRLYEGLRTTMWDAADQTALAKHETEYKSVEDTAIFVQFKLTDKDEYLLIWTTTPWTIPLNLAVMVNPELTYIKVQHKDKQLWIAQDLHEKLQLLFEEDMAVLESVTGKEMEGWSYTHPFATQVGTDKLKAEHPNAHTVVLSKEFVETSSGSGLVHCAPGCGPEDFEVGYRNNIPAFNSVNESGEFTEAGKFSGMRAKLDDKQFVELIEEAGMLVHAHSYVHDYPHAERSKQPVIFRTTKQWFLKIDDIKEEIIKENNEITWNPKAGYNAFNNWLENLRDNSISKQRYWGTPIPIWRNVEDSQDFIVVGSASELKDLSGVDLDDLHRPQIDEVVIQRDGKTYKRIPDILDVWVDAGTTLWNSNKNTEYLPADCIIEGKDQIRGWFNLLHLCSMIAFGKKAFKNCYMHAFINDSQGRKFSKSLKNGVAPEEVTDKHGADVLRFYAVGAASPGVDMNYNPDDVSLRARNLRVLWNVHKFLLDMHTAGAQYNKGEKSIAENYAYSKLHTTIKEVTAAFDAIELNQVPQKIETFFLDLSRTYIQLVRDKANSEEKDIVFTTLLDCVKSTLILLAPVAPFVTEQMYTNLKSLPGFESESIHEEYWPKFDDSQINLELEASMHVAQSTISQILSARDQAKIGVRWPLQSVILDVDEETKNLISRQEAMILNQTNIKEITYGKIPVTVEVKPNYKVIGKVFGQQTADVVTLAKTESDAIANAISNEESEFTIGGFALTPDMFETEVIPESGKTVIIFENGRVELNTERSDELFNEGFARELTRRLQDARKKAGLQKQDTITLFIGEGHGLDAYVDELAHKVGVKEFVTSPPSKVEEVNIKDRVFTFSFSRT